MNMKMAKALLWIVVVNNVCPMILCTVSTAAIIIQLKTRQARLQESIAK